ncbi:MAG: KH domain-containing protein [Candidatus Desulfatibia sp.]|uniref:KH domain-containing protein n=1 Tax=Candidatus Desulfatibia sp. TaxID=3101189 RepID=UPI002F3022AC
MKDLIKRIVQALVDNPEQVEVFEVKTEHVSVFELRVAKEDMGKVIGKKGRTAQAIRTILNAASGKQKKHNIFEILE